MIELWMIRFQDYFFRIDISGIGISRRNFEFGNAGEIIPVCPRDWTSRPWRCSIKKIELSIGLIVRVKSKSEQTTFIIPGLQRHHFGGNVNKSRGGLGAIGINDPYLTDLIHNKESFTVVRGFGQGKGCYEITNYQLQIGRPVSGW